MKTAHRALAIVIAGQRFHCTITTGQNERDPSTNFKGPPNSFRKAVVK